MPRTRAACIPRCIPRSPLAHRLDERGGLAALRSILRDELLTVVVQDPFLTETAELADVVLPTAIWGEKTGVYTNADRTVHVSDKAVEPPGEARTDMQIFIDYAERMELRDKDGAPLVKWSTPEECFAAFRECSRGQPNDQTGLSYEKLRGGSGIQWPCNENAPDGTERLYTDLVFPTDSDRCEDFGHDLLTGAAMTETEHRALAPAGRAVLKSAEYVPPHEVPGDDYPLLLTTGRTVYHFHTRTKTRRARQLDAAAPEPWVELSPADADRLGVDEGDLVRVESPRGALEARARISDIREGVVFAPFHYGYWDTGEQARKRHTRAANELTLTDWDPVSKQPLYKTSAVRVRKLAAANGERAPAPDTTASAPATTVPQP